MYRMLKSKRTSRTRSFHICHKKTCKVTRYVSITSTSYEYNNEQLFISSSLSHNREKYDFKINSKWIIKWLNRMEMMTHQLDESTSGKAGIYFVEECDLHKEKD